MAYWPWQGYEGDPGWDARKGAFIRDGGSPPSTIVPDWLSSWNAAQEHQANSRAFWDIVREDKEYEDDDGDD